MLCSRTTKDDSKRGREREKMDEATGMRMWEEDGITNNK